MQKRLTRLFKNLSEQRRDPRYIFVIIVSALIFTICFLQVRSAGLFDSVEKPVFHFFNGLPHGLYDLMFSVTQLGGLGSIIIWMAVAWYLVNRRAAYTVLGTGFLAWSLAKVAKVLAHRGRPGAVLHHIHLFDGEKLSGYGFPSGHSTFSAACVAVLYYQVPVRYRKYLLLATFSVGISRLYLGAHFPLDVVGGWALGALIGSAVVMTVGLSNKGVSAVKIKKFLRAKGLPASSVTFAAVDARGSRPLFITTEDGNEYFGKLFGKQEHAADWLFKLFRFFRYKNLQAEEPHISSRRNVEIEAFAMLWAKQAGVRVTRVIDILNYGSYWLSIQDKIDAKPLSELQRISKSSLEDTWRQVRKLHAAKVAHRDLRAANVMIDKQGKAYLIDFGFAEVSAGRQRLCMDNAELLMSMSLAFGVKRTVAAAETILGAKTLKAALPYLQLAVFSGATTKLLKQDKQLLSQLKDHIKKVAHVNQDVEEAQVLRINRRKLLNFILLAIFVYVVAPQFGDFKHTLSHMHIASAGWFVPLVVASMLTYVLTGLIYMAMASVPLKLRESSLVQLAASFMSKIVPGGLGGTALNAKYLTKAGMDPVETSAVIAGQAFVGFVMFMVPLGLFLLLNGTNVFKLIHLHVALPLVLIGLGVVLACGAICALVPRMRHRIERKYQELRVGISNTSVSPRELSYAAAASLAVTVAYVSCLYIALQSVGVHAGVSIVILSYALAVLAKSTIPAPGGLGPVEAAMIGALVSFGIAKSDALSAVLLYRLATFWIPIPFSVLSYRYLERKRII